MLYQIVHFSFQLKRIFSLLFRPCLHLKSYRLLQRCPVRGHWRRHSATTGSASRCSATNHRRPAKWPHHAIIARHSSPAARVSAHYFQNCVDDIRLYPWPITSVLPWHLFTDRLCSLSFSASLCWQRWHDCTMYSDRALWSAQFPRRGTLDLEHVTTSSQEQ